MKTTLKTRITRTVGSVAAALLVTFTGLHLIATYALPEQGQASVELAAASAATPQ